MFAALLLAATASAAAGSSSANIILTSGRPQTLATSAPIEAGRGVGGDVGGTVSDSTTGKPLNGGDVLISRDGRVVARTSTDAFGRYTVHDLPAGRYLLEVRLIGFAPIHREIQVPEGGAPTELAIQMIPAPIELKTIEVSGTPVAVDTRSGNQVFKLDEFQGSPTLTTSQIVQQALAGAARAPTGEVHIRGQHAEFSYFVDGLPVPPGISGSLNELFDPSIASQISFQTGGWDAEYGLRNVAVVDVTTRIPVGKFHADASSYVGSFSGNGQTIDLSGNSGKLGYFLSGTRQATDLRREPVVADTDATGHITGIRNYANDGDDYFGFGKLQYAPNGQDLFNLVANWSRSSFQTPFDSAAGIIDDREKDVNGFVNAGWRHRTAGGPHPGSESFAGIFYRHGSLKYTPGTVDDPTFTFAPDTVPYNVSEDRSFDLVGVKLDYLLRFSERLSVKAGTMSSLVHGHETFQSFDSLGAPGPASDSPLNGHDLAFYLQTQIAPSEKWEVRAGIRYDLHNYPLSATQDTNVSQFSPRVKLTFFPSPSTTLWAYYGRQFVPTNTEDLRAITSATQAGVVTSPTLPERDDFYEAGIIHRFRFGVVAKLSGYHKKSTPGIDDTQVPGTAITTDVNIDQVRITGLEGVIEVRPGGPLTGFLNLAIAHAYGYGAVTGGFFTITPPAQTFDLDHDQRLSATAGLTFAKHGLLLTTTGIYGSGLTNGVTPNTPGVPLYDPSAPSTGPLGTGLFDFNKEFKVDPNFILNASAGYTFTAGKVLFRPSLYVDNVFDKKYPLKGAFFSGASFGRPRTFQVRLAVGI